MNQLFAAYATGKDNKELMSILGEAALTPTDLLYAKFADEFEKNDIWKHFAAVQNGRVYDLDSSLFGMSANFSYQQALEALQPMLYNS